MRIRFKPWARQELEASNFYIDNPEKCIGKWRQQFKNINNPLYLELGCGKGNFISHMAIQNPNINFLAIDLVDAMLGLAKRNIEEIYNQKNKDIDNVIITRFDIERILLMLNESDSVDKIYINFCNPWPKGKHRKKRLTHTKQLEKYKVFLNKEHGEICFKTDDDDLFNSSLTYFEECGFVIIRKTYDLHSEENWRNIETEHEKMFTEQGIKIKALIAKVK